MHLKVNTHTPPPVNRYINSHRTADTPGGIQRLMCVIFKMKSYYMKKEPVVKKMCFIVFKKYYHLSSRHVNKKSITLRSFLHTKLVSLLIFSKHSRLTEARNIGPLLAKKMSDFEQSLAPSRNNFTRKWRGDQLCSTSPGAWLSPSRDI